MRLKGKPWYQHRCRGKPEKRSRARGRTPPLARTSLGGDRKMKGWIKEGQRGGWTANSLIHAGHGISSGQIPRRATQGKKLAMTATRGGAIDHSHRVKLGIDPALAKRIGGNSGRPKNGNVAARKNGEIGTRLALAEIPRAHPQLRLFKGSF